MIAHVSGGDAFWERLPNASELRPKDGRSGAASTDVVTVGGDAAAE